MVNTSLKYKNLILIGLVGLLFAPLIESTTKIKYVKKLEGAVWEKDTVPKFTFKNWFNGDFQRQQEVLVSDSFGFRNIFVRINNQVDFSLFSKAHAKDVVIGKDNYLYDKHYINGYLGTDFIGSDSVSNVVARLKFINDTLSKLNKTLILVIAPNKAAYYPEYIPDSFKTRNSTTTYGEFVKQLKQADLKYIDFNSYFIAQKNKSKYLLMPKNGTHWSMYGAAIAGDSILHYIEKVRNIKMPELSLTYTTPGKDSLFDIDIENAMNLLFNLSGPSMEYPRYKYINASTNIKPNVLIVGDSYYWGLDAAINLKNCFTDRSDFWYYFKKLEHKNLTQQDVKEKIAGEDIVIILATAHNWGDIGWGFIETTYNMFKGIAPNQKHTAEFTARLDELVKYIKTDKNWLSAITKDAHEKGISVDSAIVVNAIWTIEHDKK